MCTAIKVGIKEKFMGARDEYQGTQFRALIVFLSKGGPLIKSNQFLFSCSIRIDPHN